MEFKLRTPFMDLLGMTPQRMAAVEAEVHLELREQLTNS